MINDTIFQYVICKFAYEDSTYMCKIRGVCKPEYMDAENAKTWLKLIFEFYDSRGKIPNSTEIEVLCTNELDLKRVREVKAVIGDMPSNFDHDELIANTETYCRERAVMSAIEKIAENRANPNEQQLTSNEIVEMVNSACNLHIIENIGWDFFGRINDFCAELTKPFSAISTGFKWLDDMLHGGWDARGKALYVIAGQTNVGKSIFLGQFAIQAMLQNKTTVLISLEMSEFMYAKRIVANLTKIGMNELETHISDINSNITTIKTRTNGRLFIKEFPTRSVTPSAIAAYIEELKRNNINPDIVVVDYMNLLLPGQTVNNTYMDGKIVSEKLRAMSCKYEIPFVTATQLNRSGFGKDNPSIETVAESIGTSYTCDAQFAISQTDEQKTLGILNLSMQKNRYGPNFGRVSIAIDYPHMTLTQLDSETESVVQPEPQRSVVSEISDFDGLNFNGF